MNRDLSVRELLAHKRLFHPEIYPSMIKRNAHEIIFLLWRDESLGDYVTWSMFETDDNKYYVRRVIWKQYVVFKLKDPDTFASEYPVPQEMVSSIMKGFSSLDYNGHYCRKNFIVVDGVEYGFRVGDTKISWREPVEELAGLIGWCEETLDKFEKLF